MSEIVIASVRVVKIINYSINRWSLINRWMKYIFKHEGNVLFVTTQNILHELK